MTETSSKDLNFRPGFIFLFLVPLLGLFNFTARAQKSVLTQHNDLGRTGWYSEETVLNRKNVKRGSFGKIFSRTVDDQIYAQPLVILNLNLPAKGNKNLVFVATVNNTVYAFDADSASVEDPYWKVNLTPANSRPPTHQDMTGACGGNYNDFSGKMGIVGTPVIDSATNTLYVVARSLNTQTNLYYQHLHALDITTGSERAGSPKLITAQVDGTADENVNGKVIFNPQKQNQRPGLLLLNGIVYIAWASHCDWQPYHGWMIGYDKATLEQKIVYNTTPDGGLGGIWMSGSAPSADEAGNIYAAVGNGTVGKNGNPADVRNRSESALKLTPQGNTLTVSSYFSPSNIDHLEAYDLDFGVTQMLLIPETNRVVTSAKDGKIYLLDRDNMGGFNTNTNNVIQTITLGAQATLRSSYTYYRGAAKEFMYSWSENDLLTAFAYNRIGSKFDDNPVKSGVAGPTGASGAFLSVSSKGNIDSTAILWATYASNGDANQSVRPGILRAFDATDVTRELWNSSQSPGDSPGSYAKFNNPTVINGKVYLGTFSNKLAVYGLIKNQIDTCNTANIALNKKAVATSIEGNNYNAGAAFDGNLTTRWASEQDKDPQSIYVDLGKRYDLCRIVLKWEVALGKNFQIQLSDDVGNWQPAITIQDNTEFENYLDIKGSARYIRVYGTERGTGYGYSLYEVEVYGKESAGACLEPTDLKYKKVSESSADIEWTSSASSSYIVEYKTTTASEWKSITTTANTITLKGLSCNTPYFFRVKGNCKTGGQSSFSANKSFTTLECTTDCELPTRWFSEDVGDVGFAGSACAVDDVFNIKGSGKNVSNTEDALRMAYQTLISDREIKCRISTIDENNPAAKAGIMIRESLNPGSKFSFVGLSANGIVFENRIATNAALTTIQVKNIKSPYWLKLVKTGTRYSGYYSPDGNVWTQIGSTVNQTFGDMVPAYAGMTVTSQNPGLQSYATFDNYTSSGVVEVEIKSFTANLALDKSVELNWTTTLENNIENIIIERSTNNINFTAIDTVAAKNKGKATELYKYNSLKADTGLFYYRLLIVGNDGKMSYSAPAYIRVTNSKAPLLYPVPSNGTLYITPGTEPLRFIYIYDTNGRLIKSFTTVTEDRVVVYILDPGVYIAEIRTTKSVFRQRFVVLR